VRFNVWFIAPIIVLISVGLTISYRMAVPERSDWKAATDHVRAHLASLDGVTWAPYYMGEGRMFLHDLPAFHTVDETHADFARYQRVWLLSASTADTEALTRGHQTLEVRHFGAVTIHLLDIKGPRVVADLYADLKQAMVSKGDGPKRRACSFWDGRGWYCDLEFGEGRVLSCLRESTVSRLRRQRRRRHPECGLNPWLNVSRDVRVIGRAPRRCVWFHPDKSAASRIEWVPQKQGDKLVIDYGFTDKVITDHSRENSRTQPASLRLIGDGTEIGTRVIKPEPGWHRWTIDAPTAGNLIFEITTASHVDAHFCFDATIRASAGVGP
jgi:hypothetical protein